MELIFGPEEGQEVKELGQKSLGMPMRVGGVPTPWARPLPRGQPGDPLPCSRLQHLLYIPKLPEHNLDREFRHRMPL